MFKREMETGDVRNRLSLHFSLILGEFDEKWKVVIYITFTAYFIFFFLKLKLISKQIKYS